MRDFTRPGVMVLFCCALFAQSSDAPGVVIADIHPSAKSNNDNMVIVPVNHGRLEIRKATMFNLLSGAFGIDGEKIVGGPNWLELDRYDVIAKVPADPALEKQGPLLKALLEQRFKLVAREETRPYPTWALTRDGAKKPQMKEADGTGESGCKFHTEPGASDGNGPKLFRGNPDGTTTVINLGTMVQYSCRNMTMAAFADGLRSMVGIQINAGYFNPTVLDRTNLKGKWNFDVKWSLPMIGPVADGQSISASEALEKQLGLKLEEVPVPTKVVVVYSVERKPTDNPPNLKEVLPDIAKPTEFEVADVKLADPNAPPGMPLFLGMRIQPGGRFVVNGAPLRLLLGRAFDIARNDQLAGVPNWVDSVRVSITAKVGDYPSGESPTGMDPEFLAPLLRSLLKDRFGLVWHSEERNTTAYSLVAVKPKLKKADPESRIYCKNAPPAPNRGPADMVLNCQNATMALFAERLQNVPTINAVVDDATGLEGGWDFNFAFNPLPQLMLNGPGRGGGDAGPGGPAAASDPSGGYTVFESLEKELGLKLEAKKKMAPVIVIDKLNQKPTEN